MEQRGGAACYRGGNMCEIVLRERIGKGGNAEVWLGEMQQTGKQCVVKKANRNEMSFLQLDNERRILEYLMHEDYRHAPEVYCFSGKELVMEYVEGITLDRLELKGYEEAFLKELFVQLCILVEELHSLRIPVVHRDIKPANIMLDKKGSLYLIDFGTAMMIKGYAGKTHKKDIYEKAVCGAGTKKYAAPEQYGGLTEECFETDIYQLGKTIEFLLGKVAASDKFREEIMLVTRRCCAPDPRERYHRISEIKADLIGVKTVRKNFFLKNKIFLKRRRKGPLSKSKNADKTAVFIDIVRTFDTIEFL